MSLRHDKILANIQCQSSIIVLYSYCISFSLQLFVHGSEPIRLTSASTLLAAAQSRLLRASLTQRFNNIYPHISSLYPSLDGYSYIANWRQRFCFHVDCSSVLLFFLQFLLLGFLLVHQFLPPAEVVSASQAELHVIFWRIFVLENTLTSQVMMC